MKNFKTLVLAAMVITTILAGCATGNTSIANESAATIQQKIVKGKTTKADLRITFGEPSETGINEGKEYWAYQMARSNGISMIPFASLVTGSLGTSGKYLRITFDKKGIVESYTMSETNI
jgi:outer membrane protein assembly factor BamE (lipoprotein component of BamABCDE complex)